jgi:hypothetical protein
MAGKFPYFQYNLDQRVCDTITLYSYQMRAELSSHENIPFSSAIAETNLAF